MYASNACILACLLEECSYSHHVSASYTYTWQRPCVASTSKTNNYFQLYIDSSTAESNQMKNEICTHICDFCMHGGAPKVSTLCARAEIGNLYSTAKYGKRTRKRVSNSCRNSFISRGGKEVTLGWTEH